jgi:hypothetical protein
MRAADVFGGKLWCEADQDVNFDYKTYQELLTKKSACVKDASGFNRVVRAAGFPVDHVNQAAQQLVVISGAGGVTSAPAGAGQGTAVLMNLSPQWYNAYRVAGFDAAARRDVFMKHVRDAGCRRWVSLKGAGAREFGYEITYWRKDGRTILFVVSNPEVAASSTGGGNAVGLKSETIPVTLEFSAAVKNVRDERAGKELGEGKEFTFDWPMNQAIVVSFEGAPPKQVGDPAPP